MGRNKGRTTVTGQNEMSSVIRTFGASTKHLFELSSGVNIFNVAFSFFRFII